MIKYKRFISPYLSFFTYYVYKQLTIKLSVSCVLNKGQTEITYTHDKKNSIFAFIKILNSNLSLELSKENSEITLF